MKKPPAYEEDIFCYALAAGFGVLSLLARQLSVFTQRLWPDEALYAYIARGISQEPAFLFSPTSFADHLPLFPMILSLGGIVAPGLLGFRIITVLINIVGIVLIFILGRLIGGRIVGLLSMAFLATNVFYYQQANMIHNDGLFAVFYLIFVVILFNNILKTSSDAKDDFFIVLGALLVSACKWYGIFWVLPILAGYYMFNFSVVLESRWRMFLKTTLWVIVPLLSYFIFKIFYIHAQGGIATFHPLPWWAYWKELYVLLGGKWHLLCVILGFIFLWHYPIRVKALVYIMALSGIVMMSFVPEKDSRYILPTLFFWGLIFAIGLKEVVQMLVRPEKFQHGVKIIFAFAIILMFCVFFERKDLARLDENYRGFSEAGQMMREADDGDAYIFAGSPRQMKYAANIKDDRRVERIPLTREMFLARLQKIKTSVIFQTDIWDSRQQPDWIYPITSEKQDFLIKQGFRIQGIVRKPVAGKTKEVVYVFFRPKDGALY